MNNGKDLEILTTNLKTILRQNKKEVLLRFLFDRGYSYQASSPHLKDQIDSLQQKGIDLKAKLENPKYALRSQNRAPDDTKIIQQGILL